jgi:predicted O-linked N-acetylglucosamine transferase (SPINDLY family)
VAGFQQAVNLHQRGMLAEAEAAYREILRVSPGHFDATHLLGVIALQTRRPEQAVTLIGQALTMNPGYADAHYNLANAFGQLQRHEEALASYNRAIALRPDHVDSLSNRGNLLCEMRRYDQALASYARALALQPGYAEVHGNRGNALHALRRYDEALASYDMEIMLKPDHAAAYYNRATVLCELQRHGDALVSFARAIALRPDHAEALSNRGNALCVLGRHEDALISYSRALAAKPDHAAAYQSRGAALRSLRRYRHALLDFDKAIALQPELDLLHGDLLSTKRLICDWTAAGEFFPALERRISAGHAAAHPFGLLNLSDTPALHRKAAEIFVRSHHPASDYLPPIDKRAPGEKIRLGYFSADFHDHATMHLMAGMFEAHDRSKFEINAFSLGPDNNDWMRERVARSFDQFIDLRGRSDWDAARLTRQLGIDIALDLKGFTEDARLGIFSYRAAPIQVSYIGYPGTTGAPYIDYVIADCVIIPKSDLPFYTENVVWLPDTYQANDNTRPIGERPNRTEAGLPSSGFVFCCFNNTHKITPEVFDIWMRILRCIEGSVLWLFASNPDAVANLRREAIARQVDADRLIFAERMPQKAHLARLGLADLFLDTLPYNAHTTASDALWAGVPVLTCQGNTFASRVGASLLNAIQLPELIAATLADYEARAIDLATRPDEMGRIKTKLLTNRRTAALFDTSRFTRHIEKAYTAMYERYQAGLTPDDIVVTTDPA